MEYGTVTNLHDISIPKNCKNCGAPLTSATCAYCGTEYQPNLNLKDVRSITVETDFEDISYGKRNEHIITFRTNEAVIFETKEGNYIAHP